MAVYQTGRYSKQITVGGIQLTSEATRSAASLFQTDVDLPVGIAGTLSTRTSDTAGVLTLATGHEYSVGDFLDIYYADGMRYGAEVTEVATDDVTFTSTAGSAVLPSETTAVVATELVEVDADFEGDDVEMIVSIIKDADGFIEYREAEKALAARQVMTEDEDWSYLDGDGSTNPLASTTIDTIVASNSSSSTTARLQIAALLNNTT